ncbi:antibiotic biosynthesis monooxygenase [uncultured Methanoregula sp.]|uniref:antibiotic biosynthesis monooxygenase n=1 Tax=uncultured Methanoregula sp. TaxID=1005933 RepID=UPI002AAB41F3|nr:antibiotic biosynthesis monooxygenase [uncultured Methanoregula sp.]
MAERVKTLAVPPENPITVVRIHYVKEGSEPQFEAELKKLMEVFSAIPANLGITIFRPGKHHDGVYRVVYKFASRDELDRWHASPTYLAWLETERGLTIAPPRMEVLTGLETWFTLPGQHVVKSPKRYKQAIISWIAVFPLTYVIALCINPFVGSQDLVVQKFIAATILIPILAWAAMPALTRVFAGWLYEPEDLPVQGEREPFR